MIERCEFTIVKLARSLHASGSLRIQLLSQWLSWRAVYNSVQFWWISNWHVRSSALCEIQLLSKLASPQENGRHPHLRSFTWAFGRNHSTSLCSENLLRPRPSRREEWLLTTRSGSQGANKWTPCAGRASAVRSDVCRSRTATIALVASGGALSQPIIHNTSQLLRTIHSLALVVQGIGPSASWYRIHSPQLFLQQLISDPGCLRSRGLTLFTRDLIKRAKNFKHFSFSAYKPAFQTHSCSFVGGDFAKSKEDIHLKTRFCGYHRTGRDPADI